MAHHHRNDSFGHLFGPGRGDYSLRAVLAYADRRRRQLELLVPGQLGIRLGLVQLLHRRRPGTAQVRHGELDAILNHVEPRPARAQMGVYQGRQHVQRQRYGVDRRPRDHGRQHHLDGHHRLDPRGSILDALDPARGRTGLQGSRPGRVCRRQLRGLGRERRHLYRGAGVRR